MKRGILAMGALAFALGSSGSRAEYPTLRARPKPLTGIPAYPYEPAAPQPRATVTGAGQSRITLGTESVPTTGTTATPGGVTTTTTRETVTASGVSTRFKTTRTDVNDRVTTTTTGLPPQVLPDSVATFALKDQVLRVDHCSVSGVSVALYPDGKYVVRFRADQSGITSQNTTQLATPFRRNLFILTVRGIGADPVGETLTATTKTGLLQLPIEPFWVNRNEPYMGFVEGSSDAVKRNYRWIDRVEVDFTYR